MHRVNAPRLGHASSPCALCLLAFPRRPHVFELNGYPWAGQSERQVNLLQVSRRAIPSMRPAGEQREKPYKLGLHKARGRVSCTVEGRGPQVWRGRASAWMAQLIVTAPHMLRHRRGQAATTARGVLDHPTAVPRSKVSWRQRGQRGKGLLLTPPGASFVLSRRHVAGMGFPHTLQGLPGSVGLVHATHRASAASLFPPRRSPPQDRVPPKARRLQRLGASSGSASRLLSSRRVTRRGKTGRGPSCAPRSALSRGWSTTGCA